MRLSLTHPIPSGGHFFSKGCVRVYRYGFNGQPKDDEVYGEGNAYAFEYRIHDARLGRFLSVDPLAAGYPWNSTYAFAENKPIACEDLEGGESRWIVGWICEEVNRLMDEYGASQNVQIGVNGAFGFVKTISASTDPAWMAYQQGKSAGMFYTSAYDVATGNNQEKLDGAINMFLTNPTTPVSNQIIGETIVRLEQANTLINGTSEERAETLGGLGGEVFMALAILKGGKSPAPEKKILSTPEITNNKSTGTKSFLEARKSISSLVEKAKGMTQPQIGAFLESMGFESKSPSGVPSQHYRLGNIRVRLDIPDKTTNYYHMHIEVLEGKKVVNAYDATINIGDPKGTKTHHKTKGR